MKQKIIYMLMSLIILGIVSLGMISKPKKDIIHYLGMASNQLDMEIKRDIIENGVEVIADRNDRIIEIHIIDSSYQVKGISVGESISKIYEVYPKEWIVEYPNHIWVGRGKSTHYGIITEYITFIEGANKTIQEIRVGYTTEFTNIELPHSNEEVYTLLEGTWVSTQDRELVFNKGVLGDNILDNIWDKQYYTVISPNEIFIKRVKEDQIETVKIRFWLHSNRLYVFAIDDRGVPIEESIELFVKKDK